MSKKKQKNKPGKVRAWAIWYPHYDYYYRTPDGTPVLFANPKTGGAKYGWVSVPVLITPITPKQKAKR
jgi:hypothetical protein